MPAVASEGKEGIEGNLANKEEISSCSCKITSITSNEDLYISTQTELSYFCAESRTYSLVEW